MVRFVLSRLGQTLAVLFTVSVIIFALMRMIPGDPVLMRLGDDFSQEAYERLREELGFDRPSSSSTSSGSGTSSRAISATPSSITSGSPPWCSTRSFPP